MVLVSMRHAADEQDPAVPSKEGTAKQGGNSHDLTGSLRKKNNITRGTVCPAGMPRPMEKPETHKYTGNFRNSGQKNPNRVW